MEYNKLETLEDLTKFGVNIEKIIQVKTPTFDPETLECNYEKPHKNYNVTTRWFTKETVEKINNFQGKIYWFPGKNINEIEFNSSEFQSAGMFGFIRLCFEGLRFRVKQCHCGEYQELWFDEEMVLSGSYNEHIKNQIEGFMAAVKFFKKHGTIIYYGEDSLTKCSFGC